jgi:hypothetical protein
MIIREVIDILGQTIYRNYSDKGVYIRNKTTGLLYTSVNSSIDYEYEETDEIDESMELELLIKEEEQLLNDLANG